MFSATDEALAWSSILADMAWWLWLIHLLSTAAMFGVIWMVQLVQYPLFERVGRDSFGTYHEGHVSRITLVVLPLMATELATAGLLTWSYAWGSEQALVWYGSLVLLLVIWFSTASVQVPQHNQLVGQFDADVHRSLVVGNWIRTVSWSLRVLAVAYCGFVWFV